MRNDSPRSFRRSLRGIHYIVFFVPKMLLKQHFASSFIPACPTGTRPRIRQTCRAARPRIRQTCRVAPISECKSFPSKYRQKLRLSSPFRCHRGMSVVCRGYLKVSIRSFCEEKISKLRIALPGALMLPMQKQIVVDMTPFC